MIAVVRWIGDTCGQYLLLLLDDYNDRLARRMSVISLQSAAIGA